MKIFATLLLLVSLSFSAQNHRFVYEYTFVKDSLNKDKPATENMTLDITEKGSKYYSYAVYESDSLSNADMEKQMKMGSKNIIIPENKSKGTVKTVINKSYPNYAISQLEEMGINNYKIEDDRKITWKILPETMKIGKFNAQKATTEMYGRKWTAWFSTELPFQDGPYKFHGLPGLIVKVEDVTKSHVMELKGVKKLSSKFEIKNNEDIYGGTTIFLNYVKYKKAFVDNRQNPNKWMLQAMGSGTQVTISMNDSNGRPMDKNQLLRDQDERAKEKNRKNNNLLELDLLK